MSSNSTPDSKSDEQVKLYASKAAEKTAKALRELGEALNKPNPTQKSDFKPIHNAALSPIPDLFEWLKKQPAEFQAQVSTMPLDAFLKSEFKVYCPHCLIAHVTMTPGIKMKGKCIQCQYFLATGKRSTLQH